jgi:hypothetical protein
MIKFGPDVPKRYVEKREENLKDWLAEQKIEYSKYLSLGLIPVAQLNLDQFNNISHKDILKKYENCNCLKKAWVD